MTANDMSRLDAIYATSLLTDRMLRHAERADWSKVAALESERNALLSTLAQHAGDGGNVRIMRDAFRQMLQANEQIRALATAARGECGAALVSACTSTRLAQTYGADE